MILTKFFAQNINRYKFTSTTTKMIMKKDKQWYLNNLTIYQVKILEVTNKKVNKYTLGTECHLKKIYLHWTRIFNSIPQPKIDP